ncbi:MAG: hypothetical protein P8016_03600 [Sedimentisphaerales bacterium]|jgi:hypothetical protein
MKKRISCKTINSILLNGETVSPESVCLFTFPESSFIFNTDSDLIPGSSLYTRKVKITRIQMNSYLTEDSIDFYA